MVICTMAFIALLLIISTGLTYLFDGTLTMLDWINTLFLCSIFFTIIGAILFIIQAGFFDNFRANIRYVFKKISKTEQVVNDIERGSSDKPIYRVKIPISFPVLIAGLILVILSTVISFMIA
ncbi:DUF3899 domain-containing protein [Oceanobacillus halotolerans]|uniref:DUF3899 domain-containing protein n=1 Tax=Oceanobacillus halotolerans TaxID=2663380 RepID=UPI0013DBA15E|nr:DUF3899 domain-containing protein [Oceanobacillus halotolerans]